MAACGAPRIDDVFGVIAHPFRRALIEHLAHGEGRVTDLAARLPVSRSAVSQHLRVMLDVGLVEERRVGRERVYTLRTTELRAVDEWLRLLDNFWAERLSLLGEHLKSTT